MTKRTLPQLPPARSKTASLSWKRLAPALLSVVVVLFAGCAEQDGPPEYVARVGDQYLLEEELQRELEKLPALQDSVEARRQIVDRWVTTAVLHQEAIRRGLEQDPQVQRMLEDSERSVLVNALVARMYEENDIAPSPAEMQSYFERHKEQLRLRESFVRVRYLETDTRAEAEEARRSLQQAALSDRDSVFSDVVTRLAANASTARQVASNYHPESRLFAGKPRLRDALGSLGDGQTAPIVEVDSAFYVVQLAERVPSGTIPEPAWIEDELARRLVIQGRKQLYARQVQRLRNEALAREDLEIK